MAVSSLIQQESDLSLIGAVASVIEAFQVLESAPVELIIFEFSDQDGCGFDSIRDIHLRHPRTRILVLSSRLEIPNAERALQAGANGFVSKAEGLAVILVAIRKVASGETYCSPALSSQLALKYLGAGSAKAESFLDGLSNRELQVIRLIGSGQAPREIAESLGISIKTVETYINHLKEKLGIRSGLALTHRAIQWMERGILQ
jgi:DNA-binding NarL/FixJ family response regulator